MAGRSERRAFSRGAIRPEFGALASPTAAGADPGAAPSVMMVTAQIAPARSIALRKVWAHPSSRSGGLDVETAWGVWTDQRDALVQLKVRFLDLDVEIILLFEPTDFSYMEAIVECRQLLILSPATLASMKAAGGLTADLEESVGVEVNADPVVLAHLFPALAAAKAAEAVPAEWRDVLTAAAAGRAV